MPTLKLLTFNTWGLKYVSKYREHRLHAIADEIADADYDVVALQEVWVEADWNYFERSCTAYPYRRLFKSGIITGPGLAILLKVPITLSFLYRFPINGRPSAFFRGDWLVGKSIAVTVLAPLAPGERPVAILNSHMHAPYAQSGDAAYSTHRACQAWDLAQLVKVMRAAGYAVVQVGDLNSKPGSLPYKLFTVEGGLCDSWEALHGDNVVLATEIAALLPHDQIALGGVTCNSRINTWRAQRAPWEACRLDYALIDTATLTPIAAEVRFTEPMSPPLACSYSDHFAYSVELTQNVTSKPVPVSNAAITAVYKEIATEIQRYIDNTIPEQTNWRKYHFFGSLVAVVGILVAISFASAARPWASVLLALVGILVAVTGVVNGMIWFFGVRSELRALEEVKLEVEDAMRAHRHTV